MSIVLFAIIGAMINAKTAYWICFSVFCMFKVISVLYKLSEDGQASRRGDNNDR